MAGVSFRALIVRQQAEDRFKRAVEERTVDELPDGDVLIRVAYSSLNYKDGLSATGNRAVTRDYPHTPGIDAAGVVVTSRGADFATGDLVVVIGYDLGMNTPGGWGEYISVPAGWVVPLPAELTPRDSMIFGTAGFTAAMSVTSLMSHGVTPEQGEILVTGATGGVGSVAVALLAAEGFDVVAATGKPEAAGLLTRLGALKIVDRDAVTDASRPVLRPRWAGVVDSVGGDMLATAIAATRYGGCVTCCGLVASPKLNTTVYPFILRGITLCGIDSVECNIAVKRTLWNKIAHDWRVDVLDELAREVTLDDLDPEIDLILAGKQRGRVVIKLQI